MSNNIQDIFQNLRNEFIIIGLTGALGSGCTTSARFLEEQHDNVSHFYQSSDIDEFNLEYRKSLRVQQFYENNHWNSFFHIRVSDILLLIMIHQVESFSNLPKINEFDDNIDSEENIGIFFNDLDAEVFNSLKTISSGFIQLLDGENSDQLKMQDILSQIKYFIDLHINKTVSEYTKVFQYIGENIRKTGNVYKVNTRYTISNKIPTFDINNLPIFIIPEIIRRTIKYLNRKEKFKLFTIDALRNIYEIEYFRNRYQSFYLFSILASEDIRQERLLRAFSINRTDVDNIKINETSDKKIEHQSINKCIGKGDVFINNNSDTQSQTNLKIALLNYIALIRKPGLFIPSNDERFMQVAFTARYNSGCISRQVGAVVTGKDGYIRGFGWNDVPEGHISCLYRTPQQLLDNSTNEVFSEYERGETFFKYTREINATMKDLPFCFKDNQNIIDGIKKKEKIYNEIEKLSNEQSVNVESLTNFVDSLELKNPTRERALHAEENAFLQIAKSGGQDVVEGTLYTTDSPCQLCAKKAMQLKIRRIVYIDAYPDISEKHTLNAGKKTEWPILDMFNGVLGSAYFKLYIPIVGIKDEGKYFAEL